LLLKEPIQRRITMQGSRLLGLILLIFGVLALSYGGFTYTRDREKARIGDVKIEVQEKEHVNIPLWVGVATALGGGLLLSGAIKN
jgi:RsiW-degrading membrane proteinase PrsW (M82 family)